MSRQLKAFDCVGFYRENSDKYEYGIVFSYNKNKKEYEIKPYGERESIFLPKAALTYLPPKKLSSDDIKKLLRYECTYAEFTSDIIPEYNFDTVDDEVGYDLEDLTEMIKNLIAKAPDAEEFKNWLDYIFDDDFFSYMFFCKGKPEYSNDEKLRVMGWDMPLNDAAMAAFIFCFFNDVYYDSFDIETQKIFTLIDLPIILQDIENFKKHKPIKMHMWTYGSKKEVCERLADKKLHNLTDEQKNDVRQIISELVAAEDPTAIETLGYSYYGGNDIYPCDWNASRDCFLKLIDMENVDDFKKCYFANTLGYIYYYGRCNDGVPEYDKAYKYFSIGAAGWIYESMYKLSDMYIHGYGTAKNTRAAVSLIDMIYEDNINQILKEHYDCKFADVALRKGNLCRDGISTGDAYYYYTIADFAIRKRAAYDHYGDSKVFMGIQKELARIREERPLKKPKVISTADIPVIVSELFNKHSCQVTVKPVKDGLSIKVKRLPHPSEKKTEKIFDCLPDYGYCRLTDEKSFKAVKGVSVDISEKVTFIADDIDCSYDRKKGIDIYTFTHHGEKVLSFTAERFSYTLQMKSKAELTEYTFASVSFNQGGGTYDYICEIPDVEVGDKVVVSANGEEKTVEVCRLFKMQLGDMPLDVSRYKKVLRKS